MFNSYLILINLLCLISAPQIHPNEKSKDSNNDVTAEDKSAEIGNDDSTTSKEIKPEVRNSVALIISYHKKTYNFPFKASITTDQKQEFYYSEEKDGLYYCPIEENVDEDVSINDLKYEYCMVQTSFKKYEDKKCKKEVKPLIIEQTDDEGNPKQCGSESRLLYKFSYEICEKKSVMKKLLSFGKKTTMADIFGDIQYPHTYEICYDHSENRVIYTKHKILSPFILRNIRLAKERSMHDLSQRFLTETYGIENLQNLQKMLEAHGKQERSPEDGFREYELQMLIPITDFALGHWMLTALHIINYSPQHKSRLQLWDVINQHVYYKIIHFDKNPEIIIYTGTWGTRKNQDKRRIYLGNDRKLKITIPQIWWKILYNLEARKATVMILHSEDNSKKICKSKKEACDIVLWRPDLKDQITGNVYCCDAMSASSTIKTIEDLGVNSVEDILELN